MHSAHAVQEDNHTFLISSLPPPLYLFPLFNSIFRLTVLLHIHRINSPLIKIFNKQKNKKFLRPNFRWSIYIG